MSPTTVTTLLEPGALPPILLAEDDPVARMLLVRQLGKAGYEVDAVADGAAALERLKRRFYPIVLTDWEMPNVDGVTLCRQIRAMELDGYVYMLLLTARDSKEHLVAGLQAGADDYLTKPVDEAELIARLNTGRRILALEQSLRAANQENRWLSITDPLTGVFNRRYLMEQLPRELERCRRYSRPMTIAMCDIDLFKAVNDAYGHGVGDEILQLFAERLRRCTRATTDWVARHGGEEFIIVFPETGPPGGQQAAEKIRCAIAATTFVTTVGDLRITTSVGAVTYAPTLAESSVTIDSLIASADQCLYASKQHGRNHVTSVLLPEEAGAVETVSPRPPLAGLA